MYYLCLRKEERALNTGFSPLFRRKIGQKKVVLHYELVVSTLRRIFFLGVCGFFLRNVGFFGGDIEQPKVKTYLFSQEADLTFRG